MDLLPTRDRQYELQTRPRALVFLTLQGLHHSGDQAEIAEQAAKTKVGPVEVICKGFVGKTTKWLKELGIRSQAQAINSSQAQLNRQADASG